MHFQQKIKIPQYKCNVLLIVSNDLKKANKMLPNGLKLEYLYADSFGAIINGYRSYCMVLNPTDNEFTLSEVVHECNHIANYILDHIGQQPDFKNDECESYLKGYIFTEVTNFLESKNILNINFNRNDCQPEKPAINN